MLPPTIPVFPLPGVVLFPDVFLPLHIFEPRYRAMVTEALAGDRIIGMVLLKPGFEGSHDHAPPVYPIGCAGVITHSEALPDGRFDIVLRGLEKFRIVSEQPPAPYRVARVEPIDEPIDAEMHQRLRQERQRLETLLAATRSGTNAERIPSSIPDRDLVNALAQYLDFEPLERQALLERSGIVERASGLIQLLEMRMMTRGLGSHRGAPTH